MQNIPIYQALAEAFAAEGVDTHFTLMGDGNMHWVAAIQQLPGMNKFSARHEHCATAMAMGYHLATGKMGVASVTCGRDARPLAGELSRHPSVWRHRQRHFLCDRGRRGAVQWPRGAVRGLPGAGQMRPRQDVAPIGVTYCA